MSVRNFAFKASSLLVIFVLLFSNTLVVLAQQPTPATPTPPASEPAAASFTISGKVTDKDGQGLAGVTIADDQGHATLTGADGAYSLATLNPGTYLVRPQLEGQALIPYYRVVKLVDKEVSGVDFYPPKTPEPDYAKLFTQPTQPNQQPSSHPTTAENPPADEVTDQSAYHIGAPGLSYRYDSTLGTSGEAYIYEPVGSISHLFSPAGLAIDGSGKLLVVEERQAPGAFQWSYQ